MPGMGAPIIRRLWIVAIFLGAFTVLWFTRRVLLLLFAAALIALVLTSLTNLLRRVVPLGRKPAFACVLLLLSGAFTGLGFWVAPSVADQFGQMAERVPQVFSDVREKVAESPALQRLQGMLPSPEDAASGGSGQVMKVFSSTFEAAAGFVFVVFSALFLAATPGLYIRMFLKLFPPRLREDVGKSIERTTQVLKLWLLGQFVSMLIVGIVTGVALGLVGIPFAMELGILAGLGEFIPFIGPLLVAIPALLLALGEGTDKFLIVLVILVVIQLAESNLIMPLVQRKAVKLPPVVTITSMFIMGGAFGLPGLFVAAPMVAVIIVLTEEWHLKRYLGTDEKLAE
jgi:predicted PurR-regulated permease PerM